MRDNVQVHVPGTVNLIILHDTSYTRVTRYTTRVCTHTFMYVTPGTHECIIF